MSFKLNGGPKRTPDASVELSVRSTVDGFKALAAKVSADVGNIDRTDVSVTRRNAALKVDVSLLKSEL